MTVRGFIEDGANPGDLPAQNVAVSKAGVVAGTRPQVNLIEGSNVTLTVADNGGTDSVDVTVASSGGGSGIGAVLFDSTLGADTATIDTGAGGVAGGYKRIDILIIARLDQVATIAGLILTFNNDTGAHYQREGVRVNNATVAGVQDVGATGLNLDVPGASAGASSFGSSWLSIPGYADTTLQKFGVYQNGVCDPTASVNRATSGQLGFLSTAAISRVAVTPLTGGVKLKASSRLLIYGF